MVRCRPRYVLFDLFDSRHSLSLQVVLGARDAHPTHILPGDAKPCMYWKDCDFSPLRVNHWKELYHNRFWLGFLSRIVCVVLVKLARHEIFFRVVRRMLGVDIDTFSILRKTMDAAIWYWAILFPFGGFVYRFILACLHILNHGFPTRSAATNKEATAYLEYH